MESEPDVEADMESEPDVENVENRRLSLGWRITVGIVAVIIIGVIAFPFVQDQLSKPGTEVETTAQIESQSAEAYFQAGNAHYEAGRWAEAITAYRQAIELDPNYQAAYANLGVSYYQQQQFDLAASQYEKALELKPDDGEVAYNLGALYLQQALSQDEANRELLDRAMTQLQQAKEMTPELAEPHFSLGVAYMALSQKDEAVQSFETFLSLASDTDPQAIQEAERYLQSLQEQ
jgi:tetratricopeptide (TPR) repeat protein